MKRNRYVNCILVICTLLCGASALAQSVQVDDGLDGGNNQFSTHNLRPAIGWETHGPLYRQVAKITDACFASCHGKARMAQDAAIPNIAGQKYPYVRKQLELFNQNTSDDDAIIAHRWSVWYRSDFRMDKVAAKVKSDMYMYVSDLVAKRPCDSEKEMVEPSVLAMPPMILTNCITCHGMDGRGEAFDIPNLAGQSETYLRNQMTVIRSGELAVAEKKAQHFRNHPVMGDVLAALSDAEIRDLAKYYALGDCRGAQ